MSFTFETQGNNTFLVYTIQEEDVIDTLALGMISNNNIPGIAKALRSQRNNDQFIKYNVTARVTLTQFFSGVVNKRRLLGVFSSVASALAAVGEYMIDTKSLLLDTDYIYVDVSNCSANLICLPVINSGNAVDQVQFFKNTMFSIQSDLTENCDYIVRIHNYLNRASIFVAEDFNNLLIELQKTQSYSGGNEIKGALSVQPQREDPKEKPDEKKKQEIPEGLLKVQNPVQIQKVPVPVQKEPEALVQRPVQSEKQPHEKQEKEMSMLYLLQHYNKENAAVYKTQKEVKKARKEEERAGSGTGKNTGKRKTRGKQTPAADNAFAIPGQQPFIQPEAVQSVQKPDDASQAAKQSPVQRDVKQPKTEKAVPIKENDQSAAFWKTSNDNFGDTVIMQEDSLGEDTVVMSGVMESAVSKPYLIRSKNNERIILDQKILKIGKERSYVDYCITGNPTISRSHADIINRDGNFYIKDNNSTNHTYVNGEMIASNQEIPLVHGMKIILSDEEFEFRSF